MSNPTFNQNHYQGYADDDVPGSATTKASVDNDWTQGVDENFRIRFCVEETNNKASNNTIFGLECRLYTGTWGDWQAVSTTSSIVKVVLTSHYADQDPDNNQRIGSGFFTGGELDENASVGDGGVFDYVGNDECEGETCLQIVGADVANGNLVEIRCTHAYLASWGATPQLTVSKAAEVTFSATCAGTTTTPDTVALNKSIPFSATCAGATATPDTTILNKSIPFSATAAGATTTPDNVALDKSIPFVAVRAGTTTTPDNVTLSIPGNVAPYIIVPKMSWNLGRSPDGPFKINRHSPQYEGLVAWWPLGLGGYGMLRDMMGRWNMVVADGSPEVVSSDMGQATLFTPADSDYLRITQCPISDYPFTLSGWIRSNEKTTNERHYPILAIGDGTGSYYHAIRMDSYSGPIYDFQALSFDGVPSAGHMAQFQTDWQKDVWYHVLGVFASASDRRLYIDGVSKATNSDTCDSIALTATSIGSSPDSTPYGYVNGLLRDIRIHERVLPDAEVAAHFHKPWDLYQMEFHIVVGFQVAGGGGDVTFSATCAGQTTTPDAVDLAVEREFSAALAGQTSTPDAVTLNKDIPFAAAAAGSTTTPDTVALQLIKEFAATCAGATATPDNVALAVSADILLVAVCAGVTTTPDTVVLDVTAGTLIRMMAFYLGGFLMTRRIEKGSINQSVDIRILGSTGLPDESINASTPGLSLWYRREGATKVAISPTDLSSLDDPHTDGGLLHIDDGYYRLDVPDAAFAVGADNVAIGGTATDKVILGAEIQLASQFDADMAMHNTPGTVGGFLARISAGRVTVVSPVDKDGDVTLMRGHDYYAADGQALEWTDADGGWPNLTGATIAFIVKSLLQASGSCINPGATNQTARVELSKANTNTLTKGKKEFKVVATMSGTAHEVLLLHGDCLVLEDVPVPAS